MTATSDDTFAKGQRIDRYEIREHVGQGGMGAVYRALDTKLGRTVALKTVVAHRRGAHLTEEIRERFMREALAASRVDHRNVVHVLDFGFTDDGTPYMVMEYLRGRSLGDILEAATAPLALDHVADVMLSVCAALRACHHVGIIHRDLKPANIFLCDTDTGWEVKVLDFGISKAPARDELTQEGQIIGTPQYLSPEQIEGNVGPESDQYALGVLLYVCLTQRLPFAGLRGPRLLRAISDGAFDPPRALRADLPEAFEAIVLRAMQVAPRQRFESIHALGQRLWDFASPRGQAQWRTFYFDTPAGARPGEAAVAGPADEATMRVESTSSLAPASDSVKTVPLRAAARLGVTKTVAPSTASLEEDAASASHADFAGESALGDAGPGAPNGTRRRAMLISGAAACIGAFLLLRGLRAGHDARARLRPSVAATPPARAPSPPAPAPFPAAPSTDAVTTPPADDSDTRPAHTASRRRHATARRRPPTIDGHGIGIPAD